MHSWWHSTCIWCCAIFEKWILFLAALLLDYLSIHDKFCVHLTMKTMVYLMLYHEIHHPWSIIHCAFMMFQQLLFYVWYCLSKNIPWNFDLTVYTNVGLLYSVHSWCVCLSDEIDFSDSVSDSVSVSVVVVKGVLTYIDCALMILTVYWLWYKFPFTLNFTISNYTYKTFKFQFSFLCLFVV